VPQLVVRAVADGAVIRELPLAHSGVNTGAALYVSGDGQRVAARFRTGTDARWLAAWDIPSGAPVLDLTWDAVQMTGALAWLPDDRTLAVGVRVPDTRNSQIAFFETGADA
jgi:hypothetical protein